MAEISLVKEDKNGVVFKIDNYEIHIPHKIQYSLRTASNMMYSPKEEDEMLPHKTIIIKNKKSGYSSTKRCFQYEDTLLEDLQKDYNGTKTQFNWK